MVAISYLSAALALAASSAASPLARRNYMPPANNNNDGFPTPNSQQLLQIEKTAGGTLSNAGAPPKLANGTLNIFQLIRFNENFEVEYFKSLLKNVTDDVPDFKIANYNDKAALVKVLATVVAQEELHSLNADAVLTKFGVFSPPPCTYKFPTTKLGDAIALASTFTDVVLGTLQDASQGAATNGDAGVVRAVASVIGQEGEQNGFYRTLLERVPSSKPFLTTSVADFAFSALVGFVDHCPFDLKQLPFTAFTPLNVLSGQNGGNVEPKDQTLTFSVDLASAANAAKYMGGKGDGLFVTYLTGQNKPTSQPISNVRWAGSVATFEAFFPFQDNVAFGLSIAALTTSNNFATADDLPKATLAAPGLIQVNEAL